MRVPAALQIGVGALRGPATSRGTRMPASGLAIVGTPWNLGVARVIANRRRAFMVPLPSRFDHP
jgi:hypothetical protein